ncbi:hypothetical protein AM592_22180 [Bacillus gobiensis]|uniref:Uncharacterized protein n=1 Tax=Bacillus gobiensis TaxID=1441095 RepID=A0A0M4FN23_9BACI|nr:hypothetical protein AM592_22180 [Bacillus gobiensis]
MLVHCQNKSRATIKKFQNIITLIPEYTKGRFSGVTKKTQFLNFNAEKLGFFIFTYRLSDRVPAVDRKVKLKK